MGAHLGVRVRGKVKRHQDLRRLQRHLAGAGVKAGDGDAARAIGAGDLQLGFQRDGGRRRISTGGAVADVAAIGGHVADLRTRDGGGGFRQHRQAALHQLVFNELGEGGARADANSAVGQLAHPLSSGKS